MRTIKAGDITTAEARERIERMLAGRRSRVAQLCRKHGAIIEAKAAAITPVDTGFLRRANKATVEDDGDAIVLTVENRMKYAIFQHNYPHHHSQPNARDHFIALPFAAELPILVDDITDSDMEALQ